MGVSPVEYLIGQKIQRACSYLSTTSWSVKDIARELAFDDPYYFSRCFKQRMAVSPRHYRQSHLLHTETPIPLNEAHEPT
jgi:AraC-like DNA-binding protein